MRQLLNTKWLTGVAFVLLLIVLIGDAGKSHAAGAKPPIVVTQIPVGGMPGTWSAALPGARRYPSGSRIVLVEPGAGDRQVVRVLSAGLDAAGAPSLAPQGDRIVFAGRRRADARWCIFEVGLERGAPELRLEAPGDCSDPVYLPGGELVCVVTESAPSTSYLYKLDAEGQGMRITFGAGAASHPTVLRDGRLLFSMAVTPALDRTSHLALFTLNPDGTLLEPFAGVHDGLRSLLRARQSEDGRVLFLPAEGSGPPRQTASVAFGLPMGPSSASPPNSTQLEGIGSVEPEPAGGSLITAAPSGSAYGVYRLVRGEPTPIRVFDPPAWEEVEALPVVARRRPRARPTSLDAPGETGTLICYDARRSDGVHGPSSEAPPPAEISVEMPRSAATASGLDSSRLAESAPGIVELGRISTASDRSFFVSVPSDVPLRVRSFDERHRPLSTSGWFWIRPGETRACFGCHERRDTAPQNRRVLAIQGGPEQLQGLPKQVSL